MVGKDLRVDLDPNPICGRVCRASLQRPRPMRENPKLEKKKREEEAFF